MRISNEWKNYECLDAGNGEKLERWGNVLLRRPEPLAMWPIEMDDAWKKVDGVYYFSPKISKKSNNCPTNYDNYYFFFPLECHVHLQYESTWSGNCHWAVAVFFIQQVVHHKLESYFFCGFYSEAHVNSGIVRIMFFPISS